MKITMVYLFFNQFWIFGQWTDLSTGAGQTKRASLHIFFDSKHTDEEQNLNHWISKSSKDTFKQASRST